MKNLSYYNLVIKEREMAKMFLRRIKRYIYLLSIVACLCLTSCKGPDSVKPPKGYKESDINEVRASYNAKEQYPWTGFNYVIKMEKDLKESGTVKLNEEWPNTDTFPITKDVAIVTSVTLFDDWPAGSLFYKNEAGNFWINAQDIIVMDYDKYFCITYYYMYALSVKVTITLDWFI